jgi:hypothetical protein
MAYSSSITDKSAPWNIDRTSGVSYSAPAASGGTSAGADRAMISTARRNPWKTSYSAGTPGGGIKPRGAARQSPPTRGGYSRQGSNTQSVSQREVQRRPVGPLPLTAGEIGAYSDRRRLLTSGAEATMAEAERQRGVANEQWKEGRFGINSSAQSAVRDTMMQAGARGRGQARSGLQVGSQLGDINQQRTTAQGQLSRDLAGAEAGAAAAKQQAQLARDAALAKLEQEMAVRKSMPASFFNGGI